MKRKSLNLQKGSLRPDRLDRAALQLNEGLNHEARREDTEPQTECEGTKGKYFIPSVPFFFTEKPG
jgi:hypothetical protein